MAELCACGKPLHYTNSELEKIMRMMVEQKGETITVTVGDRSWRVPRHFIALHGIDKGSELPELAAKYGFEEIAKGKDVMG